MARHVGGHSVYLTVVLAAGALVLSACGSSGPKSSGGVTSGGTITYALDEDLAGFNQLWPTITRTSFPVACASASSSPWRWPTTRR